MGIDQNESRRRRKVDAASKPLRQPYAALEHRVIDSAAYSDLGFAAKSLLVLLVRQLRKDNNGHLQATFAWCKRYGFGSEHTLRAAIGELISHGFIYRSRSHGANGAWARYALTWLPVKNTKDLFMDGFEPHAYRHWQPMPNGFSSRQKVLDQSGSKCSFTPKHPAETAGKPTAESAEYEAVYHGERAASTSVRSPQPPSPAHSHSGLPAWLLAKMRERSRKALADRGVVALSTVPASYRPAARTWLPFDFAPRGCLPKPLRRGRPRRAHETNSRPAT